MLHVPTVTAIVMANQGVAVNEKERINETVRDSGCDSFIRSRIR